MSQRTVRVSAAGASAWIPLNTRVSSGFQVSLNYNPSAAAVLGGQVEHTYDNIQQLQDLAVVGAGITRAAAVATMTWNNHGLSVGDWLYFIGCGAPFDGQYPVATVPGLNSLTFAVAASGAAAALATGRFTFARVLPHATLVTLAAARKEGVYTAPVKACRLNLTSWTSGFADLTVIQTWG